MRREEHRLLRSLGDERLADTRYLWLYHPDRVPERSWVRFKDLIDGTSKTARCWHLKELAMLMWEVPDRAEALATFKGWYLVGVPQPAGADEACGPGCSRPIWKEC